MKRIFAATLLMCIASGGATSAETVTWDGNGAPDNSGGWNVAGNWDPEQVPGSGDDVVIPAVTGGSQRTITIPAGNPVTVASITTTGGSSASSSIVALEADLTVSRITIADNKLFFDIPPSKTLTLNNTEKSTGFRNVTGDGCLAKDGPGQLVVPGFWPNWTGFTGTFWVKQGSVGSLSSRDDGNFVYFGNADIVIEDGAMLSVRAHESAGVAASVTVNGSGLAGGTEWNANAGALRFYLDGGLETYHCDLLIVGDSGGTVGAERLWAWAPASVEAQFGTVTGNGTLTKVGECLMTLGTTVDNAGGVVVEEGGLHLEGSTVAGDVTINAPPDPLPYDPDSITKLTGTATINGKLTMHDGSALFPRQIGPGREVAPPQQLNAGSAQLAGITYEWHINNAEGVAGTNWDLLDAGTSLEIVAAPESPMTIKIVSLTPTNDPGQVMNFDDTHYSWTIARADSVAGFDPEAFEIDATGFRGQFGAATFMVALVGNELRLQTIYGDVTGDCRIDILDMIAVRNHLGQAVVSGENDIYDVTGDTKIDILDMLAVRNWLGANCPEP